MAKLYVARFKFGGDPIGSGRTLVATVKRLKKYERERGAGRVAAYIVDEKGMIVWTQEVA